MTYCHSQERNQSEQYIGDQLSLMIIQHPTQFCQMFRYIGSLGLSQTGPLEDVTSVPLLLELGRFHSLHNWNNNYFYLQQQHRSMLGKVYHKTNG